MSLYKLGSKNIEEKQTTKKKKTTKRVTKPKPKPTPDETETETETETESETIYLKEKMNDLEILLAETNTYAIDNVAALRQQIKDIKIESEKQIEVLREQPKFPTSIEIVQKIKEIKKTTSNNTINYLHKRLCTKPYRDAPTLEKLMGFLNSYF